MGWLGLVGGVEARESDGDDREKDGQKLGGEVGGGEGELRENDDSVTGRRESHNRVDCSGDLRRSDV
jgi:hypothetical protein